MKATTIKLEGELLEELEKSRPESVSISAYVREILRRDLLRRKLSQAADEYRAFLEANPDEIAWLNEWDHADLVSSPKRKKR